MRKVVAWIRSRQSPERRNKRMSNPDRIRRAMHLITGSWRPKPFDGPVTIIGSDGMEPYHQASWAPAASSGAEIRVVAGSPHGQLVRSRSADTATIIAEHIERADRLLT